MAITFYKYQGTGNDFIMIDDRDQAVFADGIPSAETIAFLCNRQFGIGADGLILLRESDEHDFTMVYFNSDGYEGSMCGNGGRCAVAFARHMGIIHAEASFMAVDGVHHARILAGDRKQLMISLQINHVKAPDMQNQQLVLNTGSPHLVVFADHVNDLKVEEEGRLIRFSEDFADEGINVNFVETLGNDTLFVRTYERGVERETLSCGTGVTAAALGAWIREVRNVGNMYNIKTPGGLLKVSFTPPSNNNDRFTGIWLTGPASHVYEGEITI